MEWFTREVQDRAHNTGLRGTLYYWSEVEQAFIPDGTPIVLVTPRGIIRVKATDGWLDVVRKLQNKETYPSLEAAKAAARLLENA